jgi:hypothetical protein
MDPTNTRYNDIVNWLVSVPADATLTWGDDHVRTADVHTGWVDVRIAGADLDMNWVWTIVDPDDDDAGADMTTISVPFDRTLWAIFDDETFWFLPAPAFVTTRDAIPGDADRVALETAIAAHPDKRSLVARPAWSAAALDAALADWAAVHAGRGDVRFVFDPEFIPHAGMLAGLDEIAAAVADGTADTYEIGKNLRATGAVFDQLLALEPDEAADIMRHLNEFASGDQPT